MYIYIYIYYNVHTIYNILNSYDARRSDEALGCAMPSEGFGTLYGGVCGRLCALEKALQRLYELLCEQLYARLNISNI